MPCLVLPRLIVGRSTHVERDRQIVAPAFAARAIGLHLFAQVEADLKGVGLLVAEAMPDRPDRRPGRQAPLGGSALTASITFGLGGT